MQFQSYKIADLIPASYNPRKKLKPGDKEYEKIKNSIKEFGYVEPIIINSDMTIIGGHQRATVLADLGYTEVECIVVDIDKTKEKALNVALNKITGEWNKELLADLIKDLEDSAFDVGITGFEPPEIEQLFNSVHDKKITEDDFDVEAELAKPTVAKTGDVWLLGKHRVICGDSILPETYERLMDGRKANLVLTDPPYNVNVEETAGKIKNDNMPDEDFYKFLFAAFVNMEQSMEQDASIYVFHADTEGLNFRKAFKDAGFYLSGCCIWKKNALVLGRSPYQWQHEPCLFGWKKGGKSNEEIASEVIAGKWGNGAERQKLLSQAGYDYSAVQSIVNKKLSPSRKSVDEIAREVIHGDWGNGSDRKKRITSAGYDYSAVQKRVNELLK